MRDTPSSAESRLSTRRSPGAYWPVRMRSRSVVVTSANNGECCAPRLPCNAFACDNTEPPDLSDMFDQEKRPIGGPTTLYTAARHVTMTGTRCGAKPADEPPIVAVDAIR